ncbi:MAG TPA: hypothetical protein VLF68_01680 [Candidatus Saccharimonadales bacterium]|nr:hypothetical protein [Candidatus Saccharimonadales bacterium]
MVLALPVYLLLLGSIVLLSACVVVLLIQNAKASNKTKSSTTDEETSGHLIDSARDRAFQIVETANHHAQEILENARVLSQESKKLLDEQLQTVLATQTTDLQKTAKELTQAYQEKLSVLEKENIQMARTVSKDIEDHTMSELRAFEESLKKETIVSQKSVDSQVQKLFESAKSEIEEYKKEQIEKIDTQVISVLQFVTKQILGQSLSFDQHNELLLKALEQAKKQLAPNHES